MKKNTLVLLAHLVLLLGLYSCGDTPSTEEKVATENHTASEVPTTPNFDYTIDNDNKRVGDFKIGGPITSTAKEKGYVIEKRMVPSNDSEQPLYIVSGEEGPLLQITPQYNLELKGYEDRVGSMVVVSDRYQLEQGIGVGTTLAEFKQQYPDAELWYSHIDNKYMLMSKQLPVQFLLDKQDYTGAALETNGDRTDLEVSDFKTESAIVGIVAQ
jgi:hypothetical protein